MSFILCYCTVTGVRQDDWEGGGTGTAEHQRVVQGCSVMSKLQNCHRQEWRLQQNGV
jgi:hypothetical protein